MKNGKNGIIVYTSKYGATKKYVDWLVESVSFQAIETAKATPAQLEPYDTVLLCGGVYASGIAGLAFLRKNYPQLAGKKVAVLCVGASPFDEKAIAEIKTHNLKAELKDIPLFYARGKWDEAQMTFADRTLCKLLQKMVAKKDPATYEPWEAALMCAVGTPCDWTDKAYLQPLLAYLNEK
ncbi:MAG: flavodoxin domain-containing protein [Gemmiger sp.]|nr:flavodoxin domain-containing protein [Gemmiger sp.]